MTKKKSRIGDIAEIVTPAGLAYVQYSHYGGSMGQLVRVLPGLHEIRPDDFAELALQKELYFVFYTLEYALGAGEAQIVSNQPIPEWAAPVPLMRQPGLRDVNDGRVVNWRIDSAMASPTIEWIRNTPPIYELSPELRRMSIRMLVSHPSMVKKLARGWTPERDEEEEEARYLARLSGVGQPSSLPPENPEKQRMEHFLYFAKRDDAEKAAEWLRERDFSAEIKLAPDGESWLTLAKHSPPEGSEMEALRDELEALAERLHGEYDGWGMPV